MRIPTICHICAFAPEYGGSFIESIVFLSRYCRNNLQIATFCLFPDRAKNRSWLSRLDEAGVGYGFIPYKRNVVEQIRYLLSDRELLLLHTHFFFFDLTAVLLKCTIYKHVSIVWHYHSQPPPTWNQKLKNLFKLGVIFGLWGGRCIAVGDGVFRSLQDVGLPRSKVALIHNTVNTGRFTPNSVSRANVRRSLKVLHHSTIFLLLGYAPRIKGVDIFLKAAAEVRASDCSDVKFLIVGRGETRAYILALPYAYNLGDALIVIDPVEDFPSLLSAVDVMVSASRTEGLAFSVLEAMCAEKLILSSDIPSVRETYGRSDGVWLFPTEDWKMLAELMGKSLRLPLGDKQSLGLANREYVIENHSLDRWCEKVGRVYKELIPGRTWSSQH